MKNFIFTQMEFYSSMCQNRNYIWKQELENTSLVSFEAILENFTKDFSNYSINAALSKLLETMYIDQKPRIAKGLPKLCKLAEVENPKNQKKVVKKNEEDVQITMVKKKIFEHFETLVKELENLPTSWEDWEAQEFRKEFKCKIERVYNQFTYQLLKITG